MLQKIKAKRTAAGAAPREFHPSGGLPKPCPLPATLLTLGLWLQGSKRNLTEQETSDYSHEKLKGIFTKAHRVNRGIYYLSSLRGYTSTTLFLNPSYECLKGSNRKSKIRVYGRIQKVLPETLRLFDGTTAIFDFPFAINGLECSTDSIYRVYKLAFENAGHFELLANRGVYSGQQKRIIKQLIELGGKVNGKSR